MNLFKFAVLAALLCASFPASAETRLVKVPYRYLVVPPSEAGSKRIKAGDIVLQFPLRWQLAAVLIGPVEVSADDRRVSLHQGQALAHTQLAFDDPSFASSQAFCVPRVADPIRKAPLAFALGGILGKALARSITDSQFCLIDRDGDGQAEYSVLVNAGSEQARTPRRISPVPYVATPAAVVTEGDEIKVVYWGGRQFDLQIIEQGKARRFDALVIGKGPDRREYRNILRYAKMDGGSIQLDAVGTILTATAYDKATDSILVQWPAKTRPVFMPIPDDVRDTYRGY